jgi:ribosomal protein S18 acetylase RimI-like enzyme
VEAVGINEAQVAICAALLSQAFHEDPLEIYTLPDPAKRREVSPKQFEASLRYGCLYGLALTTGEEPRGAAVWLGPGETEFTRERAEAAGMTALPRLLGPEATERSFRIWNLFGEARKKEAGARYWYLMVIGVSPVWQGHGIGGALLRPVLRRADGEELACFVEAVRPSNRAFYERHGFRLVWDHGDTESGLRLLSFLRPSRG